MMICFLKIPIQEALILKIFKSKGFIVIILIVLCVLIIAGVIFGLYMKRVNTYQDMVKNTIISDVKISDIPDGSYTGEYDVDFIYAKVEVVVSSGVITNIIILEHRNDRGNTAESITGDIISSQSIDVDAVSGATNSSTVLRKAVELALIEHDS